MHEILEFTVVCQRWQTCRVSKFHKDVIVVLSDIRRGEGHGLLCIAVILLQQRWQMLLASKLFQVFDVSVMRIDAQKRERRNNAW